MDGNLGRGKSGLGGGGGEEAGQVNQALSHKGEEKKALF